MGQTITLRTADGHQLSAYVAGPENATKALVIVQEIFGVNAHMRHVADDYAAQGYRVISPALFDRAERGGDLGVQLGYDQQGLEKGLALRAQISEEAVLADVEAAARLVGEPGRPVGIIGFCWGGLVSWWGSTRSALFQASVCWYGGGIVNYRNEQTRCPVQMHYGELDTHIPMSDVEAIQKAQPGAEIFTYAQADHGFGCEERPSFNPEANRLARERSLAFFAKHL